MKKKILFIILSVLIISGLTACSAVSKDVDGTTESTVTTVAESTKTTALSTTEKETITASETTTQKSESSSATTARPAEQKSVSQSTTKKQSDTTVKKVNPQTTVSKKSETTKAVVITAKPSTTKKITTTEKSFDVDYWVSYAKNYAKSVGLNLNSDAVDCWDNPINANSNCKYLERDIKDRLNRYAKNDDMTDVWIWAEQTGSNSYQIYIGYA